MSRITALCAIVLLLVIVGVAVQAPAVPGIDACQASMLGFYSAQFHLDQCLAGWGGFIPESHCNDEMAAIAAAQDAMEQWCNFTMA